MTHRNILYLQEALICIVLALVAFTLKTITFSWGGYEISLFDGLIRTDVNSLWYYNFESAGMALFASSFALLAVYAAEIYRSSFVAFVVKYFSVGIALFFICRAAFHIITFNLISIIEYIAYVVLLAYLLRRAHIWYMQNLQHRKNESITTRGLG